MSSHGSPGRSAVIAVSLQKNERKHGAGALISSEKEAAPRVKSIFFSSGGWGSGSVFLCNSRSDGIRRSRDRGIPDPPVLLLNPPVVCHGTMWSF